MVKMKASYARSFALSLVIALVAGLALLPRTADSDQAVADPSGVPMPVGDIPGWRQVMADDFTGTQLNTNLWHVYSGHPGGDPAGMFAPSHVSVSNGALVISTYRDPLFGNVWTSGGVGGTVAQTYGKYEVRFRMDAGKGIAHALLLWPASNAWPPEVDFSEDNGGDRLATYATLHYGPDNTQIQHEKAVDLTKWNTVGVQWGPGQLAYTLNGQPWATVSSDQVPEIPMTLDMQVQAWGCGLSTWENCPDASTPPQVNMDIDWAVAYAPD